MHEVRTNTVDQGLIYIVSNGSFLANKHVFLPFTVKSLTVNVELVKLVEHGIFQ